MPLENSRLYYRKRRIFSAVRAAFDPAFSKMRNTMAVPFPILISMTLCLSFCLVLGCGSSENIPSSDEPGQTNDSAAPDNPDIQPVQAEPFGKTEDGQQITKYLLTNKNGLLVSVIDYGAIVMAVNVPDRDGQFANVTLSFENLQGYEDNAPYFGAVCGRYANRIAKGKFTIDGTEYQLATNNVPNHLHGGNKGFNKAIWRAETFTEEDAVGVELNYVSPDGEENYPGELRVTVRYSLTNNDELKIQYTAYSDKKTHINLTNHTYWNLAGQGNILDHELTLHCDKYLPVDETLIPTGELRSVAGTPMDFTKSAKIGSRFADVKGDDKNGGYDHCYVLNETDQQPALAARVYEPASGRVMEVFTTEPGVQLYTGNFLGGSEASGGFQQHHGFCLECQHFPDSPNRPDFPSSLLEPGVIFTQETVHKFSVQQ
jgi:aldose 1-epimerase